MVAVYKFMHRGIWVAESPGHYYWISEYRSKSRPKLLLWSALDRILVWVCLKVTKEWRLPKKVLEQCMFQPGDITLLRERVYLDPRELLYYLFYPIDDSLRKTELRTSLSIHDLIHVAWRSYRPANMHQHEHADAGG